MSVVKKNRVRSVWPLPESVKFSSDVTDRVMDRVNGTGKSRAVSLMKTLTAGGQSRSLMKQQLFVREFLDYDTPYRGLLLYHGLGSGKTCAAIAAAVAISGGDPEGRRRVIVMLPASLRTNFEREVDVCGDRSVLGDGSIEYINYNGMSKTSVNMLVRKGFDGAVVVIDEVHNFVSSVANGGLLARVYEPLMEAVGCKLILLSGTPLVNSPHEMALIVNLINGYVITHVHPLTGPLDASKRDALSSCPDILHFSETTIVQGTLRPAILVSLAPRGFVRSDMSKDGVSEEVEYQGPNGSSGPMALSSCVQEALGLVTEGGRSSTIRPRRDLILPNDREAFDAAFVDEDSGELKNVDVLERALLGKVSYFEGHAKALYPTLRKVMIVRSYLSSHQFAEYSYQRAIEVRRETAARMRQAKARKGDDGDDSGMGYRPFTRAICNFSFPHDLPRPYRTSVAPDTDSSYDYDRELSNCILRLKTDFPERLRLSPNVTTTSSNQDVQKTTKSTNRVYTLETLSSKYAAILGRILGITVAKGSTGATTSHTIRLSESDPSFPVVESLDNITGTADKDHLRGSSMRQISAPALTIVYSQFRKAEGVSLFSSVLDANGFAELQCFSDQMSGLPQLRLSTGTRAASAKSPPKKRCYIVFSNDKPELMDVLLSIFNNRLDDLPISIKRDLDTVFGQGVHTNIRGDLVSVMLITRSGAEGISTRNVREVHVMEPFWHANRVEQVIGRARRAHSHDDLPMEERYVDVYVYMSTFSAEQAKLFPKDAGRTSDEFVHNISQRKRKILKEVYRAMRRTAVDCGMYTSPGKPGEQCYRTPAKRILNKSKVTHTSLPH